MINLGLNIIMEGISRLVGHGLDYTSNTVYIEYQSIYRVNTRGQRIHGQWRILSTFSRVKKWKQIKVVITAHNI